MSENDAKIVFSNRFPMRKEKAFQAFRTLDFSVRMMIYGQITDLLLKILF